MIAINIFGSQFTIVDASTIEHHNTAADHVMLMDVGHDEFTVFFREYFQQHLDFSANGRLKAYKPERNEPVNMMANAMLQFGQLWVPANRKTRSIAIHAPANATISKSSGRASSIEQMILERLELHGSLTIGILVNKMKHVDKSLVTDCIKKMIEEKTLYSTSRITRANGKTVVTIHTSK